MNIDGTFLEEVKIYKKNNKCKCDDCICSKTAFYARIYKQNNSKFGVIVYCNKISITINSYEDIELNKNKALYMIKKHL